MDILKLIMRRASIRKYKGEIVPLNIIKSIVSAGIWGPSVLSFQPWKFVVIVDKCFINKISKLCFKKSQSLGIGPNILLSAAARNIESSAFIICVYNTHELLNQTNKIRKDYSKISKMAEIAAISASIQNMIIVAESLGVGSCWHDIPLICENGINRLFKVNQKLMAVISFGYPAEQGIRSKRRDEINKVTFIL